MQTELSLVALTLLLLASPYIVNRIAKYIKTPINMTGNDSWVVNTDKYDMG